MNIRFRRLSTFKLEKLFKYVKEKWSEDSRSKFLETLNAEFEAIKENHIVFPASYLEPEQRKCVVTRQTTILYEIQSGSIFIISVIDKTKTHQ